MYSPEESGNVLLSEKLKSSLGKPVILTVYNMITQEKREVEVIPRANSEQILKADDLSSKDLIGVDLRFEKYDDVHEMVYLIDSVQVSSPAYIYTYLHSMLALALIHWVTWERTTL